jgi:cysteinyl-tRNA synthetase
MNWLTRIFKKGAGTGRSRPSQVFFTNTLSGKKELFISQRPGVALMYTCGPTMYGPTHIGNLRAYVFSDTVVRVLAGAGYHVRRVINITDFGHLVSEGDEGEDKMTKGLRREGLSLTMENMRAMAEKYTSLFVQDLADVNIDVEHITFPRASDYIPEQIALIKTLEQKGYAYQTSDGVYFDTSRFLGYGKLGGINVSAQQEGARVKTNKEKRNPADFVLWKPDALLGWQSPWGLGFPGWHLECSAMSRSLLGQELDLHLGGEDLEPIHHNNEIAQSEAASGRTFVHYWMHNAFLNISGEKISKSLGNVYYLSDVVAKGYHPLALRYYFLQAHYRTPVSFSWDALGGASAALIRLWKLSRETALESKRVAAPSEARERFLAAVRDDLGTPQALGVLWDSLKSEEYAPAEKWGLLEDAEAHLGLSLTEPPPIGVLIDAEIPQNIQKLLDRREKAREVKDYEEADRIRKLVERSGYRVDDGPLGTVLIQHGL